MNVFKQAKDIVDTGVSDFRIMINADPTTDLRRYNAPTSDEVAAIIPNDEEIAEGRDLILQTRNGALQRIQDTNAAYDALSYPLLFPRGEAGWSETMPATLTQWVPVNLQKRGAKNSVQLGMSTSMLPIWKVVNNSLNSWTSLSAIRC